MPKRHTETDRLVNYASTGNGSPGSSVASGSGGSGYEEFIRNPINCPTCRGLGRISKEQEGELVALIPLRDARLRPRRTILYVLLAILACMSVASLILFFLYPRTVEALSNQPHLYPTYLQINASAFYAFFTFTNYYNFSNENYFPVAVTGISMIVLYDTKILSRATNTTELVVPMRSIRQHQIQMNVTLDGDEGYLAVFCENPRARIHDLFMEFQLNANYSYLGHIEQTTLTTYQHVSCGNSSTQR